MYIYICRCAYRLAICVKDNLQCQSSPPTLLWTVSFDIACSCLSRAVSTSHRLLGASIAASYFIWVAGMQTQVLTFVMQALYLLNHLSSL